MTNHQFYVFILDWYKIPYGELTNTISPKEEAIFKSADDFILFILSNNLLDYSIQECYALYKLEKGEKP
jgi:hypothetical protein